MNRPCVVAVLLASSVAAASPAYELGQLFVRAESIAIVERGAHGLTFHATAVLRGAFPRGKHLDLPDDARLEHVTRFLAVSQGDKAFGPPTDEARLGQGIEGQRGFRGWLLYPIRHVRGHDVLDPALLIGTDGELRVDRLPALVRAHPYREAGE
ncbi:MAG TPA: hypothetical protein VLX92_31175 [Kofleriaceae bacterium]|nr:hypothetical protein [Kofleriaceae bacterium]